VFVPYTVRVFFQSLLIHFLNAFCDALARTWGKPFSSSGRYGYNMDMHLIIHPDTNESVAEVISDSVIIKSEQDAIHLLEELFASGAGKIILHKENLAPEFFDLKTRLAGAVLQKLVNYHFQVAIVGDFTNLTSDSLRAFIYESNRGNQIFFLESVETAIQKLTGAVG
jgi:hypothetical protein